MIASVHRQTSNVGSTDGQGVICLHVGIPYTDIPLCQLRGFSKPAITAGATAQVHFDLTRRDLSVWDVVAEEWLLSTGRHQIYIGASSRDLPLNSTLIL